MLKTYRITISEESDSVDFVSFVDKPAIERDFIAFKGSQKVAFNEELRIVTTPVLIPNKLIYRFDPNTGEEFNLVALEEDVELIYTKFMEDGHANNLNLMHQEGTELKNKEAFLLEVFMSDERRGISAPEAFSDLPNRTWFASYKVKDDTLWKLIKDGKINGVSIEGYLGFIDLDEDPEFLEAKKAFEELESILNKIK